jgi:hypothetical protein
MVSIDKERFEFFKAKMAEFGQSLEQPAIARLSKEYAMTSKPLSEYEIEIVDPFHWTIVHRVDGNPVKLDIQFSDKYPFSPPQVQIIEPYYFNFNIKFFGPGSTIADFLKNIKVHMDKQKEIMKSKFNSNTEPPAIQKIKASLDSNTIRSIESAKHTEGPLYLIIGTNPDENRRGRTFYDDPQYYMLDYADIKGKSTRYFRIDMTKVDVLAYLATELPGRFQIICFDWATMKYIIDDDITLLYSFFASLKALIQEDGRIYSEPVPFNFNQLHYTKVGEVKHIIDYASVFSVLGLYTKKSTIAECLSNDPVLEEVHLKRTEPRIDINSPITVITKTQLGGKRNYKRQTRRRRRIVYRKKRRTYK